MSKTTSKGFGYSTPEQIHTYTTNGQMLTKEESVRMRERRDILRKQIGEINSKINNDKPFRLSFRAKGSWEQWVKEAEAKRTTLLSEFDTLVDIITAADSARREIIKRRRTELDGMTITKELTAIRDLLCDIQDLVTGDTADRCEQAIIQLVGLTGTESPLPNLVNRDEKDAEITALRAQLARDMAREQTASQQAVNILKAQLRDIQTKRSQSAILLERLYNERYTEIDQFRKARGVTHRIHLTDEDCQAIEDAIRG